MEGLPVPAALLAALLTLLQGLPPARAGNAYRVGWGGHTPRPRVSLLSTTPPPPPQFRGEVGDTGGLSPETPGAGTGGGVADVPVGSPLLSRVGAPGAPAAAFSTTDRGGGGGATASRGGARGTPWDSGGPPWLQPWGGTVGDRDSPPPHPGAWGVSRGSLGGAPPRAGVLLLGRGCSPGSLGGGAPRGTGVLPPPPPRPRAKVLPVGPLVGVHPMGPWVGVLSQRQGCSPRVPRWGCSL